jgi:hypothetical protein
MSTLQFIDLALPRKIAIRQGSAIVSYFVFQSTPRAWGATAHGITRSIR